MSEASDKAAERAVADKRAAVRKLLEAGARLARTAPLSSAQRRIWFWEQLEPGTLLYNLPFVVRLRGALDVSALEASVRGVVKRHEALRTAIRVDGGTPRQVVVPPPTLLLPRDDLRNFEAVGRDVELARLAMEETSRPFDLAEGTPLRARLVRVAEDEHWLLFTLHHIAVDGWSVGILVREVGEFYRAAMEGNAPALPALPIQYGDFAAAQAEWLRGDEARAQLAYWTARLRGAPTQLDLRTDRPRPPVRSVRGARVVTSLSREQLDGVDQLARSEGLTRFMVLIAAFKALLVRYTHQPDVVVGTPIANRNRSDVEGLIGFFVNTLALRTQIDQRCTFRDALRRVRDTALEAYAHQDLPFDKVVEALHVDRALSRSPVFQVMFALQNPIQMRADLPGLSLEIAESETNTTVFDLTVRLAEGDGAIVATWEYAEDLFDRPTVERMAGHYATLVEAATRRPDVQIDAIPLVVGAEFERVVSAWNATAIDLPAYASGQQLFEEQARRTPDAVAVRAEGAAMTYAELDARANQLAQHLRRRGVGAETKVGVCLPHGNDVAIAYLGILKAGGVIAPLPIEAPSRRLASIVKEAAFHLVVSVGAARRAIEGARCAALFVDEEASAIAVEPATRPPLVTSLDNAAYILHTSGSTGEPKGAIVTHRGVVNRFACGQIEHPMWTSDRVLQLSSLGFDASMWEIWAAFGGGAELVFVPSELRQDVAYLARAIARLGITSITVVPSLLKVLLGEARRGDLAGLRLVFCGGESLTPSLRDAFLASSSAQLVNIYGATEATIDSACTTCVAGSPPDVVPIGRPLGNCSVYVLDRHLSPAPIGVVGEIFIGGAGLARGYLNDPALTADRFIPDPFGPPGSRLYRTGDLGRQLPGGELVFAGRSDRQIKLRGIRIELGEIESALRAHPDVGETVVLLREKRSSHTDPSMAAATALLRGNEAMIDELLREIERMPEDLVARTSWTGAGTETEGS